MSCSAALCPTPPASPRLCPSAFCISFRRPCSPRPLPQPRRRTGEIQGPSLGLARSGRAGRPHAMCHEMSCSAALRPSPPASPTLRLPCPACRSSIAFRSVRAAAGLPAARPFFARIACARAPAFAPARFAHLIARARRRRARLPSVPLGVFRAGARRSGLRMSLPPCLILPLAWIVASGVSQRENRAAHPTKIAFSNGLSVLQYLARSTDCDADRR